MGFLKKEQFNIFINSCRKDLFRISLQLKQSFCSTMRPHLSWIIFLLFFVANTALADEQRNDTTTNIAQSLIKKVILKEKNNLKDRKTNTQLSRQNLVLVNHLTFKNKQNKLYRQLINASLHSSIDSGLCIPLRISEYSYSSSMDRKANQPTNLFSTLPIANEVMLRLLGDIEPTINLYDRETKILSKKVDGPLSGLANDNYDFRLSDNPLFTSDKSYQIAFSPKEEQKNTFTGQMSIDSTSEVVTNIDARVLYPEGSIRAITLSQRFGLINSRSTLMNENLMAEMKLQAISGNAPTPSILIYQNTSTTNTPQNDSLFAGSIYTADQINEKISVLNGIPLYKMAMRVANAIVTGYLPIGKIDIGKIQNVARLTDIEGLRLTLPFQTNEQLWKSISLGGHSGYGLKNKEFKYSAFAKFKLSTTNRTILGVSYTNDYRRVDYDYNDFIVRENPLATGDIDIGGTILAFHALDHLNLRKEAEVNFTTDWNDNIESSIFVRNNYIYAATFLPMRSGGDTYHKLTQQSVTLSTRFSFDERVFDQHVNRFYAYNYHPVMQTLLEVGKYKLGNKTGKYTKLSAMMHQKVNFGFGYWDYLLEGGCMFGKTPYPFLEVPYGRESSGYNRFQFSLLNYMEYATDRYVSMHNEISLNGIIMNRIPLIRYLNLRELITFKTFYGAMSADHSSILDLPASIHPLNKPYSEIGAGFSNILHLFTLQAVWRLTDRQVAGVGPWGIKGSVRITF